MITIATIARHQMISHLPNLLRLTVWFQCPSSVTVPGIRGSVSHRNNSEAVCKINTLTPKAQRRSFQAALPLSFALCSCIFAFCFLFSNAYTPNACLGEMVSLSWIWGGCLDTGEHGFVNLYPLFILMYTSMCLLEGRKDSVLGEQFKNAIKMKCMSLFLLGNPCLLFRLESPSGHSNPSVMC